MREDVEIFFEDALTSNWEHIDFQRCESVEKGHGRIDTRTTYLVKDMKDCIDENLWPKIQKRYHGYSNDPSRGRKALKLDITLPHRTWM